MPETTLANALAFARRTYGVVPVHRPISINGKLVCSCHRAADCPHPAKHPLGRLASRGLLDASTDEAVIRGWLAETPQPNYAVVTTDDLFALDVDTKRNGYEALAALERAHGPLPHTWRSITGSLGLHILFNAEGLHLRRFAYNPKAADLGQPLGLGIDAPLYIVGPGSRSMYGRQYTWSVDHHPAETPLATPPAWLVEALSAGKPGSVTRHDAAQWAIEKAGLVFEYRDMAVASVAGKLLRAVSLDPAFVATLVHDWNRCHCSPPLPDHEVAAIIDRIANREIARLEQNHG